MKTSGLMVADISVRLNGGVVLNRKQEINRPGKYSKWYTTFIFTPPKSMAQIELQIMSRTPNLNVLETVDKISVFRSVGKSSSDALFQLQEYKTLHENVFALTKL